MNSNEFSKIVSETKPIVLTSIGKFLFEENIEAIDDVVQETYFRAFKSLSSGNFRQDAKISTWLYEIAKNESIRMNEKIQKQKMKIEKLKTFQLENQNDSKVDKSLLDSLFEMMKKIPEKYGIVLKKQIENKSEKEISIELNISQGTVKSRASRGKEILRKLAGQDE